MPGRESPDPGRGPTPSSPVSTPSRSPLTRPLRPPTDRCCGGRLRRTLAVGRGSAVRASNRRPARARRLPHPRLPDLAVPVAVLTVRSWPTSRSSRSRDDYLGDHCGAWAPAPRGVRATDSSDRPRLDVHATPPRSRGRGAPIHERRGCSSTEGHRCVPVRQSRVPGKGSVLAASTRLDADWDWSTCLPPIAAVVVDLRPAMPGTGGRRAPRRATRPGVRRSMGERDDDSTLEACRGPQLRTERTGALVSGVG